MKYQEMEKILSKINKEKEKLGKSLQKLVNLHKNEIVINNILKENKEAKLKCIYIFLFNYLNNLSYTCIDDNFSSTKGIKNILNRFMEDPKNNESKKNYFLSGQNKKNSQLKQTKKKITVNTPLISELSLNTTININNNSSVHPSSNASYILSGGYPKNYSRHNEKKPPVLLNPGQNKMKQMLNPEKNGENLKNDRNDRRKSLNKSKSRKTDVSYNKENNPLALNVSEKRMSKHF
jgi:hypothetical protein